MPHHWLLIRLKAHATCPVSHGEQIFLRSYFDENPGDDSDLRKQGNQFVVVSERSKPITRVTSERIWLQITEAEYKAGAYALYLWCEPYATGALKSGGAMQDLASGRLVLDKSFEEYRGPASGAGELYASVAKDDLVIAHEIELADSVVQFIVNEMNTNAQNTSVLNTARNLHTAEDFVEQVRNSNWFVRALTLSDAMQIESQTAISAAYTLGRLTHKNEGASGMLQDIVFVGGGHCDHKPIIRPVWGTDNRLGNRHAVYYYDTWSNIHFGFIAARMGIDIQTAMMGAGKEQILDNLGGGAQNTNATGDDEADTQGIIAGHNLGLRGGTVTRQDVLNILAAHPGWIGRGKK
jgi:hypothetical protein